MLRTLGWRDCSGIEPSPTASERARHKGVPVVTGRVEEALENLPDAGLDVVIAGFVLEHVEDPFTVVRRIAAKLRPGGQFLFSTLCVDSPDFRLYGRYWYNLDLPRHMTFFRNTDLHRLVAGHFDIENIRRHATPRDYVGSATYRMRRERHLLDRAVVRLGNRLLPACLLLAELGWSGRVSFACRKPAA